MSNHDCEFYWPGHVEDEDLCLRLTGLGGAQRSGLYRLAFSGDAHETLKDLGASIVYQAWSFDPLFLLPERASREWAPPEVFFAAAKRVHVCLLDCTAGCEDLVRTALRCSEGDIGKMDFELERRSLIGEVEDMLAYTNFAIEKGVRLMTLDLGLPGALDPRHTGEPAGDWDLHDRPGEPPSGDGFPAESVMPYWPGRLLAPRTWDDGTGIPYLDLVRVRRILHRPHLRPMLDAFGAGILQDVWCVDPAGRPPETARRDWAPPAEFVAGLGPLIAALAEQADALLPLLEDIQPWQKRDEPIRDAHWEWLITELEYLRRVAEWAADHEIQLMTLDIGYPPAATQEHPGTPLWDWPTPEDLVMPEFVERVPGKGL